MADKFAFKATRRGLLTGGASSAIRAALPAGEEAEANEIHSVIIDDPESGEVGVLSNHKTLEGAHAKARQLAERDAKDWGSEWSVRSSKKSHGVYHEINLSDPIRTYDVHTTKLED